MKETQLSLYVGVLIHSNTPKKELVDRLFELGLCIATNEFGTDDSWQSLSNQVSC